MFLFIKNKNKILNIQPIIQPLKFIHFWLYLNVNIIKLF